MSGSICPVILVLCLWAQGFTAKAWPLAFARGTEMESDEVVMYGAARSPRADTARTGRTTSCRAASPRGRSSGPRRRKHQPPPRRPREPPPAWSCQRLPRPARAAARPCRRAARSLSRPTSDTASGAGGETDGADDATAAAVDWLPVFMVRSPCQSTAQKGGACKRGQETALVYFFGNCGRTHPSRWVRIETNHHARTL